MFFNGKCGFGGVVKLPIAVFPSQNKELRGMGVAPFYRYVWALKSQALFCAISWGPNVLRSRGTGSGIYLTTFVVGAGLRR